MGNKWLVTEDGIAPTTPQCEFLEWFEAGVDKRLRVYQCVGASMGGKLFKDLVSAGLVAYSLFRLLPHRHGQPIGLDALDVIGFAGVGLFGLWAVLVKHRDVYPDYVPWVLLFTSGSSCLSCFYALATVAAWQGGPRPTLAIALLLIGLGGIPHRLVWYHESPAAKA